MGGSGEVRGFTRPTAAASAASLWISANLPDLGLTSVLAYQVVFGVLAVSIIWYFLAKMTQSSHGINVDFAFKEIPPE